LLAHPKLKLYRVAPPVTELALRLLTSFTVVIGAGLVATACTDPTAVPSRLSPPSASFTKSGYRPLTYPNSRKYRDKGFHPATASAGSSTISTRALLGKSGRTDVEVTTGTFDGGATTGSLSSVQVKGYDPKGVQLFTSTNNGLSGSSASFPYTNLTRGSGVQVKANVRGVNSTKTDVVSVSDVVHFRPDLVAVRVGGPASALVGWPVIFNAFAIERNGDVGARASCVLYVDGIAVDRSDGLWVDAGGTVDCAMAHAFSTAGTHALELRVENVNPGDFDDSNNRATASIQIVQPTEFTAFSINAQSLVDNSSTRSISTLTTIDGIEETWDQTVSWHGPNQYADLTGVVNRTLTFPVATHGAMSTNGMTVSAFDETVLTSEPAYWYPPELGASCGTVMGPNTALYVCTFANAPLAGYSTVQYDWWTADVQYHSNAFVTYYDPTCANNLCERYVVSDVNQVIGSMVSFGPDFSGRLSVQGAGDEVPTAGMATAPMLPFSLDYDYTDPGCAVTPVLMSCYESHFHTVGVAGYISFGSAP
jgi:hypothetical protein